MMEYETGKLWPDLLREVCNAYNAAPNSTTKVSPHFARFGVESELIFADPNRASAPCPASHGLGLAANISQANKVINIANNAADEIQLAKNRQKPIERILQPGDRVQVYRPQNRENKEKLFAWGSAGKVLSCNDLVAKIEFLDSGKTDYVSRAHLKFVAPRPPHLVELDELEYPALATRDQSGGGGSLPGSNKLVDPFESKSGDPGAVSTDNVALGKRRRRPPERFQAR